MNPNTNPLFGNNPSDYIRTAPILERHGTWAVTSFGLECLVTEYQIPYSALSQHDWCAHMARKRWVVQADFRTAFHAARLQTAGGAR